MTLPGNAAAHEMVRLRSVNQDIDVQIGELRARQILNAETIGNLSHVATWEAEAPPVPVDPVEPVEPETEPESPGSDDEEEV